MSDLEPEALGAHAEVPSRIDSVPAARAFLMKLLQGWSVTEDVIDEAALLTTEIMANALEHGEGLVSMTVGLEDGTLHISVEDNAGSLEPHVVTAPATSQDGRGMWIVDAVARSWGTEGAARGDGKSVWFELKAVVG